MNFTEFGLDDSLIESIAATGYEVATPVQEQVIPIILNGQDIIASAQTGTGKTAAFLLPIIHRLLQKRNEGHVNALVIVPTRELAIQISQNLEGLSYFTDISSIAVYGGNDGMNFATEKNALSNGVDFVICTPGRLIAHLNMGYVKFQGLQYLILDEADRMLDMGFHDDIMRIISNLPAQRQTLLFSATMPEKIRQLSRKILINPAEVNIAISKPPEKIVQEAFVVYEPQKFPLLQDLLKNTSCKMILIFCSRKQNVKQLTRDLRRAKFKINEIHSDLEQAEREDVLLQFRSGRLPILVATDILSRGIDIDNIDLVINYDVPHDGEDYVHRIGRTARAESDGVAITFISEKEQGRFAVIEQLLGKEVKKEQVPEFLGPVPEYRPRSKRSGGGGGGGNNRNNFNRRNGPQGNQRGGNGGGNRNGQGGGNRQGNGGGQRNGNNQGGHRSQDGQRRQGGGQQGQRSGQQGSGNPGQPGQDNRSNPQAQ
ncbi:MAG: DEAD/DEAH box helicase [Candidatus Pseudobacter hemicellulosilyticus]|uniref:DEAD/DEAH box helicase n=1 Tax=Candidatus Pseudobacter hemicellulosilyticus TaxID=3121375 RepID=A0AAJ5WR09_9BACT|nr:MAG: DEAD/DEAH box helicase [Pseudobacter sp.]